MFQIIQESQCTYKNIVNGKWRDSQNGKYVEIYSPLDHSLLGRVPAMSEEDVDEVLGAAKDAQRAWRLVPINERAKILHKAAILLAEHVDELAELLMKEVGKDLKSARSEILRTADFVEFTADSGKNITGESLPSDCFPGSKGNKISVVKREPLGVILAISPFNYPINLAASKIAPGLIVGNSIVLKPATQGSLCGLYLARIFQQAGVPDGVINTITGKGSEIGDYVTTHPNVNFINFTGSTEIGKRISKLVEMTPLLMELGGKDAAIVLEDADLELAADQIVAGAYSYSGQRCTAVKRILVIESVADQLVSLLKEKIKALKVGNPLEDEEIDVVPLISCEAADFVEELMEDAREKGAKLIIGGSRQGNLIVPTLYDEVTREMRLAWEEPFGPVVPVIRVKTIEVAIILANESEIGRAHV